MRHVLIFGAGNVGSQVAPHVARMREVGRITLVDPDRYTADNLATQQIDAREIGEFKVDAQAARLRRIRPDLEVVGRSEALEDLPLGLWRADVLLSCLDSRRSRLVVNQTAFRLGLTWIDAGVNADGLLARLQVYQPGPGHSCMECDWDQDEYALVEQEYACSASADGGAAPATGASAGLGALAASLQALECAKLLRDEPDWLLVDRELVIDARHHRHLLTRRPYSPECRMPDHLAWVMNDTVSLSPATRLEDILAAGSRLAGAVHHLALSVAGQRLVRSVTCAVCHQSQVVLRVERDLRREPLPCHLCGGPLAAAPFDIYDALPLRALPAALCDATLADVGVLPHDVLSLTTSSVVEHCEVGESEEVCHE